MHFEKAPSNLSDHDSFQPAQQKLEFLRKWINIEDASVHEGRKGEVESSVHVKLTKKTNWRMPGMLNSIYSSDTNWLKIDFHFLL